MKKIAALVETTRDRAAATVKSGSTVFSVSASSSSEPSAPLKSSAFKRMQ